MRTVLMLVVAAYLCGSIPFALLIGLARGVDVRKAGSGNVGATNVGRVLGRRWGVLCFVLDVLKGFIPVLAGGVVLGYAGNVKLSPTEAWIWLSLGVAAVVGHVFPVWLGFKGGKGVATSLGVLLGYWPILTLPGLGAAVVWVAFALALRYVSLASIAAAVVLPVLVVIHSHFTAPRLGDRVPFLVVCSALALLVVLRHRTNISRLMAGTESKIGRKH
ncbi:MAG: glycerol-3-phosphate 1-O-acyltransferase PlsY [Planctomycetes bacterium]|nr:glycerol-3-phosphate 1-O-acyltransferase PlsY [Planctomycetota bacterium]